MLSVGSYIETKNSSNIEIETEMLVGADGAHSVVLRSVGDVKIDNSGFKLKLL